MLGGDRVALARLMTLVENRAPGLPALMSRLHPHTGRAHVVGITGPPGAGKSTLTDRVTARLRAAGHRVGIVAVDPTSPFSGGAVLGDRIRMQAHFLDPGVFIRSLASRGSHGGVALATRDVIRVPEAGDAVQVMKAGLLEIADVFLVNKADRDGAERMRSELAQMLHLRPAAAWSIPVLLTQAATDGGTAAVLEALEQHRAFLAADPERARRERRRREGELIDILDEELRRRLERGLGSAPDGVGPLLEAVRGGDLDPYTAAQRILEDGTTLERLLGRR